MQAKFVYESIDDVLKPKSEEEILASMENLSPNELLAQSSVKGFLGGVKKAIEMGANIHRLENRALGLAIRNGDYEIVKVLLDAGADVRSTQRALEHAAETANFEIFKLIFNKSVFNRQRLIRIKQNLEQIIWYIELKNEKKEIEKIIHFLDSIIEKSINEKYIKELIRYLYHNSNPKFRNKILKQGLIPQPKGEAWMADTPNIGEVIFASFDKNNVYDSTWDDDIYRIDIKGLNIKWFKDPNFKNDPHYVYTNQPIPKENIELIYKGSGKDNLSGLIKRTFKNSK